LFLFAVFHHFCQYFDSFEIKIGAADISELFKTMKAPKKWQNDAIKAEKKQINFYPYLDKNYGRSQKYHFGQHDRITDG